MYAVKAIYDGNNFKFDDPEPPIEGKYEVIITFTKPLEADFIPQTFNSKDQEKILQFFGTWNDEDVNCMTEIIKEREKFSIGRAEV